MLFVIRVWFRASKLTLITFLRLAFSGYYFYMSAFFFKIFIFFRIFLLFFCFTRIMKIITGRRHWVLTEESPRLTTMDDNNTLIVIVGFYTRSLFKLPAFLNGVAGIHPDLTNVDTCPRILSGMHRTRVAACATIFLSLHNNFPAVTSLFPTVDWSEPVLPPSLHTPVK